MQIAELKALEASRGECHFFFFFFSTSSGELDILFGLTKMLPANFYSFLSLWTFIGPLVEQFLFDGAYGSFSGPLACKFKHG